MPRGLDGPEAARVLDEGCAVGEDGVVHGVPVTVQPKVVATSFTVRP